MKLILLVIIQLLTAAVLNGQNIGIGTNNPTEKLDINGNLRANGLLLPAAAGSQYDFLMKNSSTGEVGFKKGFGAVAINYIICISGIYPSTTVYNTDPWLGEIRMFAGTFAPSGWAFCNGQLLGISQNQALFSLLQFTYGGNGQTTFALPDLRGAAPVSAGANPAGYQWALGQKVN